MKIKQFTAVTWRAKKQGRQLIKNYSPGSTIAASPAPAAKMLTCREFMFKGLLFLNFQLLRGSITEMVFRSS